MRATLALAKMTVLGLRRDRVFLPAIVACIGVFVLANLASEWTIDDFSKVLFDIGLLGFHLTGGAVAVFWGSKSIAEARQNGTIDVELAGPISRSGWLVGKFLGLAAVLIMMGVLLLALWQAAMWVNDFGVMDRNHVLAFLFLILLWLVLAAVTALFSSFCQPTVAVFSAVCLWVTGLAAEPVARSLAPDTPEWTRRVVATVARVWDLSVFNLSDSLTESRGVAFPATEILVSDALYGIGMITAAVALGCLILGRRDITI